MDRNEILRELQARHWSKAELARRSGLRYDQIIYTTNGYRRVTAGEVRVLRRTFEQNPVGAQQ